MNTRDRRRDCEVIIIRHYTRSDMTTFISNSFNFFFPKNQERHCLRLHLHKAFIIRFSFTPHNW